MSERTVIVGAGIGGLATACLLARCGHAVTVVEKNPTLGGRARLLEADGFRFDMGPSWYLMPDIFQHFFELLDRRVEDYLDLVRLDPSYRVFFEGGETVDLHSRLERDLPTLERLEPGSGDRLRDYLRQAGREYEIARRHFLYRNYDRWSDLFNATTLREGRRLSMLSSMHGYIARRFRDDRVRKILSYSMVFLGSAPRRTPALYKMMSYLDFEQGVFYPRGGMHRVVEALVRIGTELGVTYRPASPVRRILVERGAAVGVELESGERIAAGRVVSNADLWHTEQTLLAPAERSWSARYWERRVLAPSAFILYLGIGERLSGLAHHNLLFARDWDTHFAEIFDRPRLPSAPSLYVCAPSITDSTVAPPGCENLFVLVPTAPRLTLTEGETAAYADRILATLERELGLDDLRKKIVYQRIYTGSDFARDYNSFGGSALGLAHTLGQSALWRPANVSRKVRQLYFVGAGTNPGIGVPICLISAELAVKRINGDRSDGPLDTIAAGASG